MKKMLILTLAIVSSLFGEYQVGDFVPDFSWQDTNLEGTNIITYNHNLSGLVGQEKKVLLMTYFYPS